MSPPVLATKLYIPPPRPKIVHRPRLIERLNQGLHRRLTLISAPAGFGKTTLVSGWIAGCVRPAAWLSLEEGDNDPSAFLVYFISALQTLVLDDIKGSPPHLGEGLVSALQSPQPPPHETVAASLLNEIITIPEEFTFVLDDYHAVESPAIDKLLSFFIEHMPPNMHLVITTREDPSLPLPRLRARGQLTELRVRDLRFTPSEAAEFLHQVMGLDLSTQDVAALDERTEGWIAGLQLAAISMQGRRDIPGFIRSFAGSHHFILDYLVEEVLSRQSPAVQSFLLRTSILDRLCGPLCDAVLLDPSIPGQETLEQIERANLFLHPLDDERRWYRYHHLFADLLQQKLRQETAHTPEDSAGEIDQLHIRASQWYEANGLEIEAFHHATAANDLARAERLIEGDGIPLHYRGAVCPVLHWVEALPKEVLDARPSLWVTYASALSVAGQNTRVEAVLQSAEAALEGAEPDAETNDLLGHIAAMRAILAATQYDLDAIIEQSRRALDLLRAENLSVRATANWTLGYAHHLQDERPAASRAYQEAISISQATGNTFTDILASTSLGIILESENKLHQAARTYQRVLGLGGEPPPPMTCEAYLGLARLSYEWNDLAAAETYGQKSLELAEQIESIDSSASSKIFLSRLRLTQGDPKSADDLLSQAEQFARRHGYEGQIQGAAGVRALVHLRQGNLAEAARVAEEHDLPLIRARVHLAREDAPAALGILDASRSEAEANGPPAEILQAMVLQAVARHANGENDEAVQQLSEALQAAQPGGFIRTFLDEGPAMAQLLSEAAARGIIPGYTGKLLDAFQAGGAMSGTSAPALSTQPLIEPLSERELEVLDLIAQGCSNREIGERLFLAVPTVKGHNRKIFAKLQVKRRTEAVARARELGLL